MYVWVLCWCTEGSHNRLRPWTAAAMTAVVPPSLPAFDPSFVPSLSLPIASENFLRRKASLPLSRRRATACRSTSQGGG